MELNITRVFNSIAPLDYSASCAEIGQNAGPDTWRAACDDSADYPILDNDEKREAFREFVRSTGAWDDVEIAAWSDDELNALCLQWVAGDMREMGWPRAWADIEADASAGQCSGRIWPGTDGEIYFYVGS